MVSTRVRPNLLIDALKYQSEALWSVTIHRRLFNTYENVDLSNVCQSVTREIEDNWSQASQLQGKHCEQYVNDLQRGLHDIQDLHCNKENSHSNPKTEEPEEAIVRNLFIDNLALKFCKR